MWQHFAVPVAYLQWQSPQALHGSPNHTGTNKSIYLQPMHSHTCTSMLFSSISTASKIQCHFIMELYAQKKSYTTDTAELMLQCCHAFIKLLKTWGLQVQVAECLLSVLRVSWQQCHLVTVRVSGTLKRVCIFWWMSVTVDPNISNVMSCLGRYFLCSHPDVILGNNRTMHATKLNMYKLCSVSELALSSHKHMTALQYVLNILNCSEEDGHSAPNLVSQRTPHIVADFWHELFSGTKL
jgi:hypothetical protein